MNFFKEYIKRFQVGARDEQTHLSFDGGRYKIPKTELKNFYEKYFNAFKIGSDLYMIEKIHNSKFCFFIDIDNKTEKKDEDIRILINDLKCIIKNLFEFDGYKCIVSKRDKNYHINFTNLVVDDNTAKQIISYLKNKEIIDTSVYRTGLRMLGSKKDIKSDVYKLYDIDEERYIDSISLNDFMDTIIQTQKELTPKVEQCEEFTPEIFGKQIVSDIQEIQRFMNEIKEKNDCLKDYNVNVKKCKKTKNKWGIDCLYVLIEERRCPFKEREHKRISNPIYIEINKDRIYIRCYDEDCKDNIFPKAGITFPDKWEEKYKELYESIKVVYKNTGVEMTDELRKLLELSIMKISHFSISKAIFYIYKNKYRVDEVKSPTWYEFDGVRWKKSYNININISEDIQKYYEGMMIVKDGKDIDEKESMREKLIRKVIIQLENNQFKNNLINQLVHFYMNLDYKFYFNLDSNPYLIGFEDGVYDLKKGEFRSGLQSDYLTYTTTYNYIEYDENNEKIKEIYKFLEQIITNKKVFIYLLKILGKSLVGLPDEKFYIWTGISGANGKSTLINFLENTLGDYMKSVDIALLTNKRGSSSGPSPDRIRLKGRRILAFQEPEHKDKLNIGFLKQATGGDPIIARELFKPNISFKVQGTMILCCNDLPTIQSMDGGTWRRIRVIDFNSKFCDNPQKKNEFKIDPKIKEKIQEWKPYFMSILIYWYKKYLEEGIEEPNEVTRATNKYRVDNNKFNEFLDQCVTESDEFVSNKDIFINFQCWWNSNYPNTKIPDISELIRALKVKYGNEDEMKVGGIKRYGFKLSINNEE